MFGPDRNSSMYDNPHDVHSTEWKRWNWEAQQKRDQANWGTSWGGWSNPFDGSSQTITTTKTEKKPAASSTNALSDSDKVVFGLAAIAAFCWIVQTMGSANWVAGVIGGFIAGYIAAKTYKIIFVLIAIYVAAVAFGHHPL